MKRLFKQFVRESCGIKYGSLLAPDEAKIREDDKIISHFRDTGLLKKYESMVPPNEKETMDELLFLKQHSENVSDEELQFALESENDETEMYRRFAQDHQIRVPQNFVADILDQVEPIMMYLKKYHNRARPEQFANAYQVPFQVKITHTAFHPAYPSGHALDSFVLAHYFKLVSPEHSNEIDEFCQRMRKSRIDVGLHYPSDNIISERLAKDIINSGLVEIPLPK